MLPEWELHHNEGVVADMKVAGIVHLQVVLAVHSNGKTGGFVVNIVAIENHKRRWLAMRSATESAFRNRKWKKGRPWEQAKEKETGWKFVGVKVS